MNRRAFFTLTLGLVATPLGAEGQPTGKVYRDDEAAAFTRVRRPG